MQNIEIEKIEQRLEAQLSLLLSESPSAADSPLRLQAFARLYAALYRFVAINNNDSRYGERRTYTRKAESLFRMLFRKASSAEVSFTERARLISALYTLSGEAMPIYDTHRDELCCEALAGLMNDRIEVVEADSLAQSALCRCLVSCLYPELSEEDDWSDYLQDTLRGWVEAQSVSGRWKELSDEAALARIEVLNRYSYMFLDNRYDARIRQAYQCYLPSFSVDDDLSVSFLYALTNRYDLSMQGNACPVNWEIADATSDAFYRYSAHYPAGSDEWRYCLSCHTAHLCEQITKCYQEEVMQGETAIR